jgi:hypothetical protein
MKLSPTIASHFRPVNECLHGIVGSFCSRIGYSYGREESRCPSGGHPPPAWDDCGPSGGGAAPEQTKTTATGEQLERFLCDLQALAAEVQVIIRDGSA